MDKVKFFHHQYLELMSIYDLEFLVDKVIPELMLKVDQENLHNQEMVLLALSTASKVLDPSLNFRIRFTNVHE